MKVSKKFIVIMAILALLLLGVSILGYYIKKNDKTSYDVYVDTFNNLFKSINSQIDMNSNSIEGNVKLESNEISFNEYKTLLNTIGGNNIDLDFKLNYEKKYAMLNMNTYYTGVEPLNSKKYYDGTYVYTYIENYYENKFVRRYLFKDEYDSFVDTIKIDKDYMNILNGIMNAFLCEENSSYFGWTEQKITIEDKKYNTYSNFLVIDKYDYKDIFKNIDISLNKNQTFLKSYKNVFKKNFNIKDYSTFIEWFINNSINMNIYSDMLNNKFMKFYLMINNNEKATDSMSIEIYPSGDKFKFQILKDVYTFNGTAQIGNRNGQIELSIPAENSETLNMKLSYSYKYKNNIEFEKITNYVDRYDVIDKVEAVLQAMMDRREISNANEIYHWYLYKTQ